MPLDKIKLLKTSCTCLCLGVKPAADFVVQLKSTHIVVSLFDRLNHIVVSNTKFMALCVIVQITNKNVGIGIVLLKKRTNDSCYCKSSHGYLRIAGKDWTFIVVG